MHTAKPDKTIDMKKAILILSSILILIGCHDGNKEDISNESEHKIKTMEKHILNNNPVIDESINVDDFFQEKVVSMYDKEWTKLEKGMKLNRLQNFVLEEKEKNKLDDIACKDLKTLLFKMCNEGQFNKANIVEYENENIISIKNLEYDEETKTYRGKKVKKKVRTTPKSKSNLDRLIKKNKS